MRIAIATVQVPFVRGGAECLTDGLQRALATAGHLAEIITKPFRFGPIDEVKRSMSIWSTENFQCLNGYEPDIVICLKFPTYYLKHTNKVLWLLHQHRPVKELKAFGPVDDVLAAYKQAA